MKYSKFFGKTLKHISSEITLTSHKLLLQAGFIAESVAGRYYFLPLGQRVMDKLTAIVDKHMLAADCQKMFAPVLHPIELWQETNRDKSGGYELMTVKDRRGAEFALGGTAEEMFVDVVRKFNISYKELPFTIYQMGYKFRDELRARGGLLRVREFLMKDAYSFDIDSDSFESTYEKLAKTYLDIYAECELKVDFVPADNGYFGGDYCHEFIVETQVGESDYFVSEDGSYIAHEDVANFKHTVLDDGDILPLETVVQPQWVLNMIDNQKHYGLPLHKYLKNVVFVNDHSNQIFVVVTRGDIDINKNKLENALDMVGLLREANDSDLEKIGTKYGYVKSFGNDNVIYVADISLKYVNNMVGGQKSDTHDTINVNYGRDFKCELEFDLAKAKTSMLAPDGKSKLVAKKGVEVGNIFHLGTHYSRLMKDAVYAGSDNKSHHFHMGCYGFGLCRTLQTVVEKHHDENGIIWPKKLAPFQVHLIDINSNGIGQKYYEKLRELGFDVLWDDRKAKPGSKFADADLIGIPVRIVVSNRLEENSEIELKFRAESDASNLSFDDAILQIKKFYE